MTTGGSGSDDQGPASGVQGGNECQVGDRNAQVVMLLFETERTSHSTASRVHNRNLESGHHAQGSSGVARTQQGFLMTVAMEQALPGSRHQPQANPPLLKALHQPGVGQMSG